jgi:hypothetical protein
LLETEDSSIDCWENPIFSIDFERFITLQTADPVPEAANTRSVAGT